MGWSGVTISDLQNIFTNQEGNISIGSSSDDQYTETAANAFIADVENMVKLKLSKMYDTNTLSGNNDPILKTIVTRLTCYELYVGVYPEGENQSHALQLWNNKYAELLETIASPDEKGYFLSGATLTAYGESIKAKYASNDEISNYTGIDEDDAIFNRDLNEYFEISDSDV